MSDKTGFLFDMDGLLLDTERVCQQAFIATTRQFDVAKDTDSAFYLTLVGSSFARTQKRLKDYFPMGFDTVAFDAEWHTDMRARLADGVPVKPHVADVLELLSGQGRRMAVVTSTHKKNALAHLTKAGLLDHFEHVTGGDEVSANKPDPAPYLETAAALGLRIEDCYAFEDSDFGITAAVRSGAVATQIPDLRPETAALPALGQKTAPDLRRALEGLGII